MSPRPFALHLMLAAAALMSSKSGLPHWNIDWPNSKANPDLPPGARNPIWPDLPEDLAAQLVKFDVAAGAHPLDLAMIDAGRHVCRGIAAYLHPPPSPCA